MSEIVLYKTTDDVEVELIIENAENPEAVSVIWPCTMGDVRMYRVPTEAFAEKGHSTIQYNPRGHGNSGGQFNIRDAVADLLSFITDFNKAKLPVTAIGHSGGCGALLSAGTHIGIEKFYFAAPVLDSRASLFYMYDNGAITEFNTMLAADSPDKDFVYSVLKNTRWLDADYWRKNNLEEKLDAVSGDFLIGRFLDSLFIDGMSGIDAFGDFSGRIELLLPSEDRWYSLARTRKLAEKHKVPVNDRLDAHDHYLTRAWRNVWDYILDKI